MSNSIFSVSSTDSLVDALPYIDQGFDEPGVREAVLTMIEEETKRYRPTKNYLEHLPPLELHAFETEMLKNEIERIERGQPMKMFSMERYELPSPSAAKRSEPTEWLKALDNSQSQLYHQFIRLVNLDLMNKYGSEAWKKYNDILVSMLSECQKQLHELKKRTQEINWQRKNSQTAAGEKVKILEEKWVMLVSKNFEIESACVELETKLQTLKESKPSSLPSSSSSSVPASAAIASTSTSTASSSLPPSSAVPSCENPSSNDDPD